MATADILTAKINHGFGHLDADGDGQLTEHDHVLMGQRTATSLGYAPGSPAEQQIIEAYLRIWRDLHLPHIPGGETAISKEQFLKSTLTLATDPAAAQATVGAVATAFLAIADTGHDGSRTPATTVSSASRSTGRFWVGTPLAWPRPTPTRPSRIWTPTATATCQPRSSFRPPSSTGPATTRPPPVTGGWANPSTSAKPSPRTPGSHLRLPAPPPRR
ncbi:MAG: hypothetical protein ACRDRP_18145 [Pseudonocardiaceae bacterium]